jgi:hypothetical protein
MRKLAAHPAAAATREVIATVSACAAGLQVLADIGLCVSFFTERRSARDGLTGPRYCGRFGGPPGNFGIGYGNQEPQSIVDRRRIFERLCDVRVEKHDVRALTIALVILAANRISEVVFRKQIGVGTGLTQLTHTLFFRAGSHAGR